MLKIVRAPILAVGTVLYFVLLPISWLLKALNWILWAPYFVGMIALDAREELSFRIHLRIDQHRSAYDQDLSYRRHHLEDADSWKERIYRTLIFLPATALFIVTAPLWLLWILIVSCTTGHVPRYVARVTHIIKLYWRASSS